MGKTKSWRDVDSKLARPIKFGLRFNRPENKRFKKLALEAGLSRAEFGRRRILGLPIVDLKTPISESVESI